MTFMEAVRTCLRDKYITFGERARRSELWWFVLFGLLVNVAAAFLDGILGFRPEIESTLGDGEVGFGYESNGPIATLTALGMLLPNIAVGVRRLHDIGRSGWWLLIGLIPIVGFFVLLWWYTRPSQPEPNQWGPNPLDPDGAIEGSYAQSRVPGVDR